tara:strand:- start:13402 stop:13596 length:195 start_codon:yes stop_codon:yes gene_type:complete
MAVLAISDELHARCKAAAQLEGVSLAGWTRAIVARELDNKTAPALLRSQGPWQTPRRRQSLAKG